MDHLGLAVFFCRRSIRNLKLYTSLPKQKMIQCSKLDKPQKTNKKQGSEKLEKGVWKISFETASGGKGVSRLAWKK